MFALGRAQELCILIDAYWSRMGLDVPIYFSAGMTEQATEFYKLFIGWTNENIKHTFVDRCGRALLATTDRPTERHSCRFAQQHV